MLYLHKRKVALFILPLFFSANEALGGHGALCLGTSKHGRASGATCSPTKQIPHQHHDGASFIRTLLLCPQLGFWGSHAL
jgi:hypothetical protein